MGLGGLRYDFGSFDKGVGTLDGFGFFHVQESSSNAQYLSSVAQTLNIK